MSVLKRFSNTLPSKTTIKPKYLLSSSFQCEKVSSGMSQQASEYPFTIRFYLFGEVASDNFTAKKRSKHLSLLQCVFNPFNPKSFQQGFQNRLSVLIFQALHTKLQALMYFCGDGCESERLGPNIPSLLGSKL